MGKNPNLLDPDEYPLVAECQQCGRYIRCERINFPWRDPHQKAGTSGEAWPVPSRYAPAAGPETG